MPNHANYPSHLRHGWGMRSPHGICGQNHLSSARLQFCDLLHQAIDAEQDYDGEGTRMILKKESRGLKRLISILAQRRPPLHLHLQLAHPHLTFRPRHHELSQCQMQNAVTRLALINSAISTKHKPLCRLHTRRSRQETAKGEETSSRYGPPSECSPNLAQHHVSASSSIKVLGFQLSDKALPKLGI